MGPRLTPLALQSALFVLVTSATAPCQSGWKNLNGKPVPAIHADQWLNVKDGQPTSKTLKGKVWLLEFFATW